MGEVENEDEDEDEDEDEGNDDDDKDDDIVSPAIMPCPKLTGAIELCDWDELTAALDIMTGAGKVGSPLKLSNNCASG